MSNPDINTAKDMRYCESCRKFTYENSKGFCSYCKKPHKVEVMLDEYNLPYEGHFKGGYEC